MATNKRETNRGFSLTGNSGAVALTNSAAETTLYSQLIRAGSMSTSKALDFLVVAQITTTTLPPNLTIRLRLGASTLVIINAGALTANVAGLPFRISGQIISLDSASAQYAWVDCRQASTASPFTTGNLMVDGTWPVDTTADQLVSITAQFASASLTTTLTPKFFSLDIS